MGRADLGRYLFSRTLVVEGFKAFLSTSYFAFSFAVFFSFFNLFAFPENIRTPPTPYGRDQKFPEGWGRGSVMSNNRPFLNYL